VVVVVVVVVVVMVDNAIFFIRNLVTPSSNPQSFFKKCLFEHFLWVSYVFLVEANIVLFGLLMLD